MQSTPMHYDSQIFGHRNLFNRMVHQVCRMYAFHDRTGEKSSGKLYSKLSKAMCIVFCDFILFPHDKNYSDVGDNAFKNDNFVHRAEFRLEGGFQITDAISITFIELASLTAFSKNCLTKYLIISMIYQLLRSFRFLSNMWEIQQNKSLSPR
jgi:hypothetical protein